MKRTIFLAAVLAFALTAGPAIAQSDEEFCAIPEGCDLDGDGVAETPAGTPIPAGPGEDQYGPDEEFCAIPEGCEASAPPDPADSSPPASPDPTTGGSVPPDANQSPPAPDSSPTDVRDDAGAGSTAASSAEGAESSVGENPAGARLTVLPETGGALPVVPILGALLVACGLLVRRVIR